MRVLRDVLRRHPARRVEHYRPKSGYLGGRGKTESRATTGSPPPGTTLCRRARTATASARRRSPTARRSSSGRRTSSRSRPSRSARAAADTEKAEGRLLLHPYHDEPEQAPRVHARTGSLAGSVQGSRRAGRAKPRSACTRLLRDGLVRARAALERNLKVQMQITEDIVLGLADDAGSVPLNRALDQPASAARVLHKAGSALLGDVAAVARALPPEVHLMNAARTDPRAYDYSHPSRSCDMVMKGGITSGVVYPHAVCETARTLPLSERRRRVGRRDRSGRDGRGRARARGRHGRLRRARGAARRGSRTNLFSVFQPQPETRGLFAILTAAITRAPAHPARARHRPPRVLAADVGWRCAGDPARGARSRAGERLGTCGRRSSRPYVLLVGAALGLLVGILRTATRALPATTSGCAPGMAEPESVQPQPLTIWLGELLERLAGREPPASPSPSAISGAGTRPMRRGVDPARDDDDEPTNRRPHRLPWDERVFFFRPSEFLDLFPERVVQWMEEHPPAGAGDWGRRAGSPSCTRLRPLLPCPPPDDLPVIVAARMSLSFPLLISAVPLWAVDMSRSREPGG